MLDTRRRGFAVMSPDLSGIGFEHEDFETCKRYCFNGDVIVAAVPKKCGISIRTRYHKRNKWFEFSRYDKVFFKTRFYFDWEYYHEYGTEVLYTNPDSYSESIKKNPKLFI